jgi:hypothetical protein
MVVIMVSLAGCASHQSRANIEVQAGQALAEAPDGRTAVLAVRGKLADKNNGFSAGHMMPIHLWGQEQAAVPRRSFGEYVAHYARTDGGLEIMPPFEVTERLETAGSDPTLVPSEEQLKEFVSILELENYLVVSVNRWMEKYVLTRQTAVVDFQMSLFCADGERIWAVRARDKATGVPAEELGARVLSQAFRRLAGEGQ